MARPTAVLVGFAGKLPLAGMALANIHCIVGLRQIGYDVHYVERQNRPEQCYDPRTSRMTDDPGVAVAFLSDVLPQYGLGLQDFSFVDREGRCHGSGWPRLRQVLQAADFVVNMGDATWFDELEACPRRAFVDTDPMFTQVAMLDGSSMKAQVLQHYGTLFTEGHRVGRPDCLVPAAGRRWIPSWPGVATALWRADTNGKDGPATTLMNWSSGRDITFAGRTFGYKNREFERFADLPSRTSARCVVAMGGAAPRDSLEQRGWELESALAVTTTIPAYQSFVARSALDFGVAKHAYVEARTGWFSDRSICYLAAGRPVLHQDTGLQDSLPVGEGLLIFSTLDEAVEGLDEIRQDYDRHSRAARRIAEEYFEASKVMDRMLEEAGWQ